MTDLTYPFDPTGTNPLNRISQEVHVVTPSTNARYFNFVVPFKGPFFSDGVTLTFTNPDNSTTQLLEGVHYYFSHKFLSASKACARELYGSLTFLNSQMQGTLRISYNTIGGNWVVTPSEYAVIIADLLQNPRTITWEQVVDLPFQFPVVDHEWDLVDMVGMKDVVLKLDEIYDVLFQTGDTSIAAHINNTSNPHLTTKAQVGLSFVENYPIATVAQMQLGTSNQTYMTPALVKSAVEYHGANLVNVHAARTDNPHNTTAAQVGLGLVSNYATATVADAQGGTSTTTFMTPALVKTSIDTFTAVYATHAANTNNPHNTTKDQIGLNLVQNYSMATNSQAQAGAIATAYMAPSTTYLAIQTFALVPLQAHTDSTSNPHNTTKAQVGLSSVENWPPSTLQQALDMTDNASYMTPLRVKQAVESLGIDGSALTNHLDNFFNPHDTTAEQVGAYTVEEVDALLLAINQALTSHANNHNNSHEVTAAQVGAYTSTQTDGAITTAINTLASTLRGELKKLTNAPKTAAYTLVVDDVNKLINTNSGVQVPPAVFSAGDGVVIYNNSASAVTITQQSGVTMRQAGTTNTGDRTLAPYGTASLLCVGANTFTINGAGLT